MIRGTVSLPHGTGKSVRVAVFAAGRRGPRGRGGRCRRRRLRRPDRAGRGRLPRLRRRHRHPRPHGPGRQARPHPRAAWPDAEPEDRHRHQRRRQDRRASSRRARSSTAPTATATCTCRSARRASTPRRWSRTTTRCSTSCCGPSPRRRRAGTCRAITTVVHDGPGREGRPGVHPHRRARSPAALVVRLSASTTSSATDLRSLRGNGRRPNGRRPPDEALSLLTGRPACLRRRPCPFSARGNQMARPEKVAVVDEIRTKLDGGRRGRAHRVPRADGPRAGRPARRRCARPAPSTRCSRTRWPAGPIEGRGLDEHRRLFEGPVAIAFVQRRRRGRGEGAARVRQGQPGAGREGRPARRAGDHARPTSRRWPTCRRARCCSRRSPACSRRRSPRRPACSRRSPATSPTASRR